MFNINLYRLSYINKKNDNFGKKTYCLSPLKCDTVSFGALKKNQFSGIDLLVVNKFKAPIEKFNSNEDLQNWCKQKVDDITKKDYKGRQNETVIQRKSMLKEWFDYVQKENDGYSDSISLLILDSVTKDLKPDEDKIPPVLNKRILADTISQIQEKTKVNPKLDVNFSKMYQMNLQKSVLNVEKSKNITDITGWVIIPSKENDPEHFEENVNRLKLLSHDNWCTKSFNAEPYLSKGDFHVYLENGKPKLGVRFVGDEIQEIQGEKNDSKIPITYYDTVKEHILDKKLSHRANKEINEAKRAILKVNAYKNKYFPKGIENYSAEYIFKTFNIGVKKDKDGLLILSEYKQPDEDFSWKALGVDENKLIKDVKGIDGTANFSGSDITKLENLKYIGRTAWFGHSRILSLGKLQYIGDDGVFNHSSVTDFGELKTIKGSAFFNSSKVESLNKLSYIGGTLALMESNVKDLGNLKYVGDDAKFSNSKIKSLKNLKYIGGNAQLELSEVTDLGNLEKVKGNMILSHNISDIGNLKYIGGIADFRDSLVTDLKNLNYVGDEIYVYKDQKELIQNLEKSNFSKVRIFDIEIL